MCDLSLEVFPFGNVGCTESIDHWHVLSLTVSLLLEWVGESTMPEQRVSYWLPSSRTLVAKKHMKLSNTLSRGEVWATVSYFVIWRRMDLGLTSDEVLGDALC